MEKFSKLKGIAALLDRADVDTDQIIPKQFLKKIERTGFGQHLFHDWRFLDDAGTQDNPDFALNQARYKGATVLVARDNFGCGSSREHAPWALNDYGFRVVIAPSFADIFYNNCFKNGMLPVPLSREEVQEIFDAIEPNPGAEIEVDLETREVRVPSGTGSLETGRGHGGPQATGDGKTYTIEVDDFRRECLLNGWDDIGLTLRHADKIDAFEKEYESRRKFAFAGLSK